MIKIENVVTPSPEQWKSIIMGARNPMNSWNRSDSTFDSEFKMGDNDYDLLLRLAKAGGPHAKYRRMIVVYIDLIAPLFLYKEVDTYKIGTVCNSCSTMHKIHAKKFEVEDFTHENLTVSGTEALMHTIATLEKTRKLYVNYETDDNGGYLKPPKETLWRQIIELLPDSYNQRRTYMMNYEVLSAMYRYRKNHKLDEWRDFCKWIETLPYSELITCNSKECEHE